MLAKLGAFSGMERRMTLIVLLSSQYSSLGFLSEMKTTTRDGKTPMTPANLSYPAFLREPSVGNVWERNGTVGAEALH